MNGRNVKEKCPMALVGVLPLCSFHLVDTRSVKSHGAFIQVFRFKLEIKRYFILGLATKRWI